MPSELFFAPALPRVAGEHCERPFGYVYRIGPDGERIAIANMGEGPNNEFGPLFAAAPEMYGLLDKIRDYLDRQNLAPFMFAQDGSQRCAPLSTVIFELLAKARGEQPNAG